MNRNKRRCEHCQIVYFWQGSGDMSAAEAKVNDYRYCPDCQLVINRALEGVPKKVEHCWVDTNDYTHGPAV